MSEKFEEIDLSSAADPKKGDTILMLKFAEKSLCAMRNHVITRYKGLVHPLIPTGATPSAFEDGSHVVGKSAAAIKKELDIPDISYLKIDPKKKPPKIVESQIEVVSYELFSEILPKLKFCFVQSGLDSANNEVAVMFCMPSGDHYRITCHCSQFTIAEGDKMKKGFQNDSTTDDYLRAFFYTKHINFKGIGFALFND